MAAHAKFHRMGVEVQEIAVGKWRVSDVSVSFVGPPPVRGFIRGLDGMFEVTRFDRPGTRSYFRSFDAALRALSPVGR